jgi:acyl dehydratase
MDQAFAWRLQACVDHAQGHETLAAYPVSEAMIGQWTDALMDDNPVYVDAAAACATGRDGVIAPPAMIQALMMPKLSGMARAARDVPGFAPYLRGAAAEPPPQDDGAEVYRILAERGFNNSAATNCRQVYHRELRLGDRVRCLSTIAAVSAEKRTAMGAGHFLTTRIDYSDQDGRPVATQHWTVLRYRTPAESDRAGSRLRPRQAPDSTFAGADLNGPCGPLEGAPEVGARTAPTVIPITPSFVIATAIATHDFYAIHHDVDWARSIGQPDIFTNILTTTGLVCGVVTRWGGPSVRLRSVDLRLLTPNYPGDELTLQGRVVRAEGVDVALSVRGVNRLGVHVEALVEATVPGR